MNRSAVTIRDIAGIVAAALVLLVTWPAPVAAHSGGVASSNFLTTITSVDQPIDGIGVEVIEFGNRIEVSNATDTEVIVPGYEGEPYLRIGPDGVFENRRSPAAYLNLDRQATIAIPAEASADAEPDWTKLSDESIARWHDHRVHWMGDQNPPGVRRDPGQRQVVIPEWIIPLQVADDTIEVRGQLEWVPGPPAWPWLVAALALGALAAYVGFTGHFRLGIAALLAVVVGLDMLHAIGATSAVVGDLGTKIGSMLTGSTLSIVGWIAGVVAIVLFARRDDRGVYAAFFAAAFIAMSGGLLDVADLGRSQLAYAWPNALARTAITAALGVGIGITIAMGYRLRQGVGRPTATSTR